MDCHVSSDGRALLEVAHWHPIRLTGPERAAFLATFDLISGWKAGLSDMAGAQKVTFTKLL
jgi:hypothetical protein